MFKDYKHERILTPIGISIDENKLPMIVLPFMANGDLLNYLRKGKYSLTVQKLLSFVQQVAEGRNQSKVLFKSLMYVMMYFKECYSYQNNISYIEISRPEIVFSMKTFRSKSEISVFREIYTKRIITEV